MPFLSVAGVVVPATIRGPRKELVEVGGRERAFDGTLRSTVRTTKREWDVTTVPTARATIDTLETALTGTPPLSAFGDLINVASSAAVDCQAADIRADSIGHPDGELVTLSFTLMEV